MISKKTPYTLLLLLCSVFVETETIDYCYFKACEAKAIMKQCIIASFNYLEAEAIMKHCYNC